ncbi:uroporphyrinogen-III synthase [Acidicapsa acidisoli]|uniref:uroporphyrinogen-III synthase n=1 Tax=Acidicapsa acidisoli TaxID=1615681 RepID=UPI0021E077F6|nr:uroporphyrinogen-III synthase [Acidicapsa acidisoli]
MNEIHSADALPLAGRRVLVTRALQQAGKLSDGLKVLGAEPVEVPVLEIRPPDSYDPLDAALRRLEPGKLSQVFDWLILTSVNTVETVAARCRLLDIDFAEIRALRVAAVGSATAEAARKVGFRVTVVPDSYHSEGLVAALGSSVLGKRVLLARAKVARDVIPDALTAVGALMTVVDAYQTALPEGAGELLVGALKAGVDVATFTSSSSVRNLAEVAREAGIAFPFAGVAAVSIGPVTSATLREHGWEPAGEARPSDIPGLIAAVELVTLGLGTME